ncbi:hypothetical protein [Xanthomonas sp. 3058]|uniref:hypothetical protein n=1 Tax=Xanthomonas sp. 3058 TaxID=3035314 RepID=UPI001620DD0F|nr:hypothetical protein [Xanthomonas sp. 3058]MBB5862575.1 hypothetical protein [Xanthomonas sp. 3058]
MRALLITAALSLLSSHQRAISCDTTFPAQSSGTVEIEYQTPAAGQSLDAFIVRIAPKYARWSLVNSREVCGAIGQAGDRYSIAINRAGGNGHCTIITTCLAPGFEYTGYTFHTHPTVDDFRFSDQDLLNAGYLVTSSGVKFHDGRGQQRVVIRFSGRVRSQIINSR